ncbi:RagB/SusD family nutrient uptake outer membrane protein [Bacteroides sp.]|uniref:RagB/SusD family nutrient uptake outer membrane protein n=1 Tax=Bacteroides sp. TaxID=29523 RepID=UPI0025C19EA4|nr:RagB/SusD family nutrient uptake outer membrane protein [Bacteroides sp.]
MKRKIYIGCLIVTALTFNACDNYLDIIPKGESTLNQTDDYLGLIEDMYGYPIDDGWYLCGEATSYNMELLENYSSPINSTSFFWDENFDRATYMTSAQDLYTMCYKRIAKYNILIENIGDSEGSENDKIAGIAQAKILRAYNYLYLINTYAKPYDPATADQERGIILRDEFSLEEAGVQKSIGDAYRLIEQDIKDALPNLPHKSLNTFRPDRSFGYALKAKMHLLKREFDQALQASLDCIKEAEGEGGHKLWDMNVEYQTGVTKYKEMIPVPMDMMIEYGGPMYGMFRTVCSNLYFMHPYESSENLLYQHGLNQFSPSPSMIRKPVIDLFDRKSDLRYTFSMELMPTRPTAETGSINLNNQFVKWNSGGIKLSEVYLIAAECYARKGDKDYAMKYVNDIRKNRFIAKYYKDITANDANEAMQIVRDERKRELLYTNNGFFDMRRFCTEFNETLTREYDGKTYTLKPTSHLLTFPFPVAAMQNSNLIQNSK